MNEKTDFSSTDALNVSGFIKSPSVIVDDTSPESTLADADPYSDEQALLSAQTLAPVNEGMDKVRRAIAGRKQRLSTVATAAIQRAKDAYVAPLPHPTVAQVHFSPSLSTFLLFFR